MRDPESSFEAEPFLKRLPQKPGVYQMLDATGIGAVRRQGAQSEEPRNELFSCIRAQRKDDGAGRDVLHDIEITLTAERNRGTAARTEPDQKAAPAVQHRSARRQIVSLHLSDRSRISATRVSSRREEEDGRYFGPFPSASAVRESINILQRLFQLRQCEDSYFKNRSRPCLQHQIGRCSAPCVQLIAPDSLRGRRSSCGDVPRWTQRRDPRGVQDCDGTSAAERSNSSARRSIATRSHKLRKIQEQQYVHAASGDVDVFAVALRPGAACVQGMFIRGGRLLGHRTWFPRNELAVEGGRVARRIPCAVLLRRWRARDSEGDRAEPSNRDAELIETALRERVPGTASKSLRAFGANARAGSIWHSRTRSCRSIRIWPIRRTCSRASSICRRRSDSKICRRAWNASTSATRAAKRPLRRASCSIATVR